MCIKQTQATSLCLQLFTGALIPTHSLRFILGSIISSLEEKYWVFSQVFGSLDHLGAYNLVFYLTVLLNESSSTQPCYNCLGWTKTMGWAEAMRENYFATILSTLFPITLMFMYIETLIYSHLGNSKTVSVEHYVSGEIRPRNQGLASMLASPLQQSVNHLTQSVKRRCGAVCDNGAMLQHCGWLQVCSLIAVSS